MPSRVFGVAPQCEFVLLRLCNKMSALTKPWERSQAGREIETVQLAHHLKPCVCLSICEYVIWTFQE